ncbi:MAG: DUF4231 domain-containing protein [Chloroflexota bacterium]
MATQTTNQTQQPKTAGTVPKRQSMRPEWWRQFPKWNFADKPDETFQLISESDLQELIKEKGFDANSPAVQRLKEDMDVLNEELMPLFLKVDYRAKRNQNQYRQYQVNYFLLATAATVIGSFQVAALQVAQEWILVLGLLETVIALLTTYIATRRGNRQPLPEWLEKRRHAEQLRREYFRFLTDAEPYNLIDGAKRARLLGLRAGAINLGKDPNAETVTGGV